MRRWLVTGLALAVVAMAAGCGSSDEDDALTEVTLFVMATSVDIALPTEAADPELLSEIEAELRQFERDFYPWSDGELARLNTALTGGVAFDASPALVELLTRARQIAEQSGGAFEPGVGRLVELWGFNDNTTTPAARPDADAIAAALTSAGSIRDLDIAGTTITAPPADYLLDLGGIAKGAAVDAIVERLEAIRVDRALINAGGDLRVLGEPADRRWRIGIQAPRADGLLGTIALSAGEWAFSSGDYERFYEQDDERFHHILDPRTGLPATHTQAVTVIATDGTLADAAATALFVAGPAAWRDMAASLGVQAVLRVDATGQVEMTTAMRERFQPEFAALSDIIAAGD